MKGIIFAIVLSIVFRLSHAQYQFVKVTIDLKDSINSKLIPSHTDNLASVLIDGYLNGKITGYTFSYSSEVIKWSAPRMTGLQGEWAKGKDYMAGDRVYYNGEGFEVLVDHPDGAIAPNQNDYDWLRVDLKEPISTKYFFPSLKDTLSKKEFLLNMSLLAGRVDEWNPGIEYQSEGMEEFLAFIQVPEINTLELLQHFQVNGKDTLYITQMVSLGAVDFSSGHNRPLIHFYFEDVMDYLRHVPLPLLYKNEIGYAGNHVFVLDEKNKSMLQRWLKAQIQKGNIKIIKDMIVNASAYQAWIKNVIYANDDWNIMQDLKADHLIVFMIGKPFLFIPVSAMDKPLLAMRSSFYSYQEAIQKNVFSGQREFRNDSLAARIPDYPVLKRPNKKYFFLEEYLVDVNSLDIQLKNQIPNIWQELKDAFYANKLHFINHQFTYFPARFDWSTIGEFNPGGRFTYKFDNDLYLINYYNNPIQSDSIKIPQAFTSFGITYKKSYLLPDKGIANFEPDKITFRATDKDGLLIEHTFKWLDIKTILTGHSTKAILAFVEQIEKGRFDFSGTDLIYGLSEEY